MKNKIIKFFNEKNCKIFLVVFVFVLCFSIAAYTQFGTGPDEFMKYDVAEYIMKYNTLPDGRDVEIRSNVWGISYAFSPYLSYIFSGIIMKVFSVFTENPDMLYLAARIPSVIFITIFSVFCIKIGEELFANKKYKWVFILLITLWPQVIYIGGYMNNDALALLSTAIIVFAWIKCQRENWNVKNCLALAVGIGLCALSYYNAYGFILLSIVFFFVNVLQKKLDKKIIFRRGLIISALAILIAGWFFVRNAIIYDGDFLGLRTETETANIYALDEYKPDKRITLKSQGESITSLFMTRNWLQLTIKSFIGLFGPMEFAMGKIIYIYYMGLLFAGIIGIFYILLRKRSDKIQEVKSAIKLERFDKIKNKESKTLLLMLFFAIIIPIALSVYYSYASDYQPQGRYIMPMIVPFAIFLTLGLENIVEATIKKEKNKKIIVDSFSLVSLLLPIYYVFLVIVPTI